MTHSPAPEATTELQHPFDSSSLPAEAFVYNAAAEMIRGGTLRSSVNLTHQMYRRIASKKTLRILLARLRREFDEATHRLTIGTERVITPQGEFEYYVNFALIEP